MAIQTTGLLKGRYRIESRLGEGGMAAVYRAFDTLHDQLCALKEFRLGYLPSEDDLRQREIGDATRTRDRDRQVPLSRERAIEQFKIEARLLARLAHPNLPKVRDYFSEGENYYLVMELIEGQTLAEIFSQAGDGPFPEEQVLAWMDQVAQALIYCHEQGVIHRDIKPANVIVVPSDKVYLVDFGTAKPGPDSATVLASFTPGYSPPEQYGSKARTDERSDIYALGATMYVLLTGREPLEAPERVVGKEMPSPRSLVPSISPAVDSAVLRAMSIRPEHRFQSVAELQAALGTPVLARRRWALVMAGALAAVGTLALVLALVVPGWLPWRKSLNTSIPPTATTIAAVVLGGTPTDTSLPTSALSPTPSPPMKTDTATPADVSATTVPESLETASSTPRLPPTTEPVPSPIPVSTATPRRQTPTATSVPHWFSAPVLAEPPDGVRYWGRAARVVLGWTSVGALAEDEYYVVHIPHAKGVEYGWSKEVTWQVPSYMYDLAYPSRELEWRVRVERFSGSGDPLSSQEGLPAGEFSAVRSFWWDVDPFDSPILPP